MGRVLPVQSCKPIFVSENDLTARTISQDVSSVTGKPQDLARAALNAVGGDQQEACALLMSGLSLTIIDGCCEIIPLEEGCAVWQHDEGVVSSIGSLEECSLLRFPRHYRGNIQLLTLETLEVYLLSSVVPEATWICRSDLQLPEISAEYGRFFRSSMNFALYSKVFKPGPALIPVENAEICAAKIIKKTTCSQPPGNSRGSPIGSLRSPPSIIAIDQVDDRNGGLPPPVSNSTAKHTTSFVQRYEVIRHIGSGAFGSVHLASTKAGALVAVKCVPVDGQEMREAQLLRLTNHPQIVKMTDSFVRKDKTLCIVMEYLPENLHRRIGGKPLSMREVQGFSIQLLSAVAYLDSLRLCHRDLKPENILLREDTLKLCDFGSAKILGDGPSANYICSRWWRAPELILGASVYATSIDWWSCGCIVAEMMSGKPIFRGESSWGQMYAIVRILGTPTPREMEALQSLMPQGGRLAKHFASLVKLQRPRQSFRELLPAFANVPGSLLIPRRLLVYSPQDRWHPAKILKTRLLTQPWRPATIIINDPVKATKRSWEASGANEGRSVKRHCRQTSFGNSLAKCDKGACWDVEQVSCRHPDSTCLRPGTLV